MSGFQILFTFMPATLILGIVAMAQLLFQKPITLFIGDMAAIADVNPFTGLLSNLGILLWCATASTCILTMYIARHGSMDIFYKFFRASGLLSIYLLIDDLFLIHEELAPRYLGVSEHSIYLFLSAATFFYLVRFRKTILNTGYEALLCSLLLLVASILVDTVLQASLASLGDWRSFLEASLQLMGIASWCSYFVHTAYHFLTDTAPFSSQRLNQLSKQKT